MKRGMRRRNIHGFDKQKKIKKNDIVKWKKIKRNDTVQDVYEIFRKRVEAIKGEEKKKKKQEGNKTKERKKKKIEIKMSSKEKKKTRHFKRLIFKRGYNKEKKKKIRKKHVIQHRSPPRWSQETFEI